MIFNNMEKTMARTIFLSMFFLLQGRMYGQIANERIEAATNEINSLLQSYDNGSFQLVTIADIDSEYTDAFETLKNCFVFVADSKDSLGGNEMFINGIYKDNQLLWLSNQILSKASDAFIIDAKDLNDDGSPEIIIAFSWELGVRTFEDWWIYSWDGITANLISQTDENGYTMIKMLGDSYHFTDVNSDNILEIVGSNPVNTDSILTYSWNGSLYGSWTNGLQAMDIYFTTANHFQPRLFSSVLKISTDTLKYFYNVYNNLSSEQSIFNIYIKIGVDSLYAITPNGWLCSKIIDEPLVLFDENFLPEGTTLERLLSGNIKYINTKGIVPGDSIKGLSLVARSLPRILPYYLQSKSEIVQVIDDSVLEHQREVQNIYKNSVSGLTVGPVEIGKTIESKRILRFINFSF